MENIFPVEKIREWEAYTIKHKPISSLNLMESAASAVADIMEHLLIYEFPVHVFCGPGNNGGDGLAIARQLVELDYDVHVFLLSDKKGTPEYEKNLKRFKQMGEVIYLKEGGTMPDCSGANIIDAIFGIGLTRPAEGLYKQVIEWINRHDTGLVFAIDIPSGMYADKSSQGNTIIKANMTLTFEVKKLAFYMPENGEYTGLVKELSIGLLPEFFFTESTTYQTIHPGDIRALLKPRKQFSHKGNYGNACLIAGSYGMMGAAVLAAHGCLRSGVGKLTCHICEAGYDIMQITTPEAMCRVFGEKYIENMSGLEDYNVIGIGPGIGVHKSHRELLRNIFKLNKPMVIDADALNVISEHKELLAAIPSGSILTPHPGEFIRLFGETRNDFEQRELAINMAEKYKVHIVLKGGATMIATTGRGFFNTSGNAGMATGGSGDVLTGILTGLLAQGYTANEACIIGVYCHGLAGDIAAEDISEYALTSADLYKYLGKAFLQITEISLPLDDDALDIQHN